MNSPNKASLLLTLASISLTASAADAALTEIGFRAGVDSEDNLNLTSYEAFGVFETPWAWAITDKVNAELQFETALGVLSSADNTAVYGHLGPVLKLAYDACPVYLTLSSGPTLLSEDTFDGRDIGGHFHFTSGIGLHWQASERCNLGYRLQHTSNANLDQPNPGLDLHTLSLSIAY